MKRISQCFVVLVMAHIFGMASVSASGWNDYSFDLPSGYQVLRANAQDIHIWRPGLDVGQSIVTSQLGVGPLFEIALDDQFIFAKNRGNAGRGFWTIVDHVRHQIYGPFSEDEFEQALSELGIDQPIAWQTLEEAYRQALRDGRSDPVQVDAAFAGTMIFFAILWVYINPVFIVFAACIALLVRWFRGGAFLKPFAWTWASVTIVPFVCFTAFALYKWVLFRFF